MWLGFWAICQRCLGETSRHSAPRFCFMSSSLWAREAPCGPKCLSLSMLMVCSISSRFMITRDALWECMLFYKGGSVVFCLGLRSMGWTGSGLGVGLKSVLRNSRLQCLLGMEGWCFRASGSCIGILYYINHIKYQSSSIPTRSTSKSQYAENQSQKMNYYLNLDNRSSPLPSH